MRAVIASGPIYGRKKLPNMGETAPPNAPKAQGSSQKPAVRREDEDDEEFADGDSSGQAGNTSKHKNVDKTATLGK